MESNFGDYTSGSNQGQISPWSNYSTENCDGVPSALSQEHHSSWVKVSEYMFIVVARGKLKILLNLP